MTLSTIVLTHNNQATIKACLDSLTFVDEIIIIDDHSTDQTIRIAKKYTQKIYTHTLNNFAAQRNFGLKKAKGDWVLFVDSDEIVPPDLKTEIKEATKNPKIAGFYLKRRDHFLGSILNHGETANVRLLRLAKKNSGLWSRSVHEVWQVKGEFKTLSTPLLHKRDFTYSQFIERLNRYTDLDAIALHHNENKPFSYLDLATKPLGKFLYNYFFLLGFLDGFAGFVFAFSMSLYSLIIRVKLWEHARI